MTLEIGSLRHAHFEPEVAWGDGFVGAGATIAYTDLDLREKFDKQRPSWYLNSARRTLEFPRRRFVDGSFTVPLYQAWAQEIVDFGLDRDTVANGFDLLKSWAVRSNDLNGAREFDGVKCDRWVISGSSDEPEIMVTCDVIGRQAADASAVARGALPATLPYLFNGATSNFFSQDISARLTSFEITVENNLQLAEGPLDSDFRMLNLIAGWEFVSLSLVFLYDDILNRTRLRAQTVGDFDIALTDGTNTLTITIPQLTLDEDPEDLDPETVTSENIPIVATADGTDTQITAVIT